MAPVHTRARRTAAIAATALVCFLASGCTSGRSEPGPSSTERPSTATPGDAASASSSAGSCIGAVRLISSMGQSWTINLSTTPRIELRVGDAVHAQGSGSCGSAVTIGTSGTDLRRMWRTNAGGVWVAARPGTSVLELGHGMCEEIVPRPPGCIGGLRLDGAAVVVVTGS